LQQTEDRKATMNEDSYTQEQQEKRNMSPSTGTPDPTNRREAQPGTAGQLSKVEKLVCQVLCMLTHHSVANQQNVPQNPAMKPSPQSENPARAKRFVPPPEKHISRKNKPIISDTKPNKAIASMSQRR